VVLDSEKLGGQFINLWWLKDETLILALDLLDKRGNEKGDPEGAANVEP
jgi:hypothetical protein